MMMIKPRVCMPIIPYRTYPRVLKGGGCVICHQQAVVVGGVLRMIPYYVLLLLLLNGIWYLVFGTGSARKPCSEDR